MSAALQNVTPACFGLSYLSALALEGARVRWPAAWLRPTALAVGAAGLLAHTIYLVTQHPTPATPAGGLLGVAWVLAVFALSGTVHRSRQAWPVFVLPVVVGLVGLAWLMPAGPTDMGRGWGAVHGVLVLFAAVGVSVGFLASVMYLVQANRLRAKANPLPRLKLLSLERLEAMNRRAVATALPLLTAGLLIGAGLLPGHAVADNWLSVKVLGTAGLWAVCLVLCYLRYAAHVSGRRLALLTMLAFALLLATLAAAHPFAAERMKDEVGRMNAAPAYTARTRVGSVFILHPSSLILADGGSS